MRERITKDPSTSSIFHGIGASSWKISWVPGFHLVVVRTVAWVHSSKTSSSRVPVHFLPSHQHHQPLLRRELASSRQGEACLLQLYPWKWVWWLQRLAFGRSDMLDPELADHYGDWNLGRTCDLLIGCVNAVSRTKNTHDHDRGRCQVYTHT